MWFNNALIFHYELNEDIDFATALEEHALKPCPSHARFIYGWVPPFSNGGLSHDIAGSSLICLGKEERILPKGVIKLKLQERIEKIELEQNRTVKRAEISQMAEDIEFELLPKSFCVQKRLMALIDTVKKRLIINSASATAAAQLTGLLRKSIPGIQIEPWSVDTNLSYYYSQWIIQPATLPKDIQLASDCHLISPDDEKKKVSCKGYELPASEVITLIEQGLQTAELSIIWDERIQLTLTHELIFKRLKCLDYLIDEFNDISKSDDDIERQDAALALLTGELRSLVDNIKTALESAPKEESAQLLVDEIAV